MSVTNTDPWFDLVPMAMAEFEEQGLWSRHNAAFTRMTGLDPAPGTHVATLPAALQQLVGWDSPVALLGLRPGDAPLPTRTGWSKPGHPARSLRADVHAQPGAEGSQRRFLCVLQAAVATPPAPSSNGAMPRSAAGPESPEGQPPAPPSDSEALLRELTMILESSPAGIAYLRGNTLVRCNRRFERMLGMAGTTLTNMSLDTLLNHDARIRRFAADFVPRLQAEGQFERELEILVPGLPTLWYTLTVKRIGDVNGPLEAIAVLSDTSRIRKQTARLEAMERDLAQQADRTRAILDSVFVGIVTIDPNGISWMNRSARRMFAGDLSDFVGKPLATVATHDIDHPFRITDYLDNLQDGQSHTFECQVMARDGRMFWVVGNAVVIDVESTHRQVTYALLDIDRRRQAEARSAEAEARLKRIIEMAPMAITVHEAGSLRLLQANQSAASFMQRDAAQAMGQSLNEIYPQARARQLGLEMNSALDAQHAVQKEHRIDSGTRGAAQIWDVNYLPLQGDGDTPDQVLMVASDITEQRAAENARLEAAITQREMLVKEVHHRIKNNLQGVAGLLQQIAARKPEVAPAIAEVVGQVQAIAQVYGLQVGTGGPLRLDSVVSAIAGSVQKTFGRQIDHGQPDATRVPWLLPEAESIPIALCLNELLTNAHKHSPQAPAGQALPLHCELQCDDQGAQICIRNPGLLPEGFSVDQIRGGVSGLGLVRALMPRRSSRIQMRQDGDWVVTVLQLTPPGIVLAEPPATLGEPTGQQYALWPQ